MAVRQPDNAKIAAVFDTMAARYDRQMGIFERLLLAGCRDWAVARARGRVLEIAVGTGLNLPRYGTEVSSIVGVDISEGMLAQARRRVAEEGMTRVDLYHGDVQALDLPDGSVDTVLSTFTFCTIPDPAVAAREAYRVLTPGGGVVLAEHGPSTGALGRAVQRAIDPLTVLFGADHVMRDPVSYLRDAGFTIDEVHRSGRFGIGFLVLASKNGATS